MNSKNAVVAAVLNFFLFGAGTLYVGRRKGVGLALMLGGSAVQAVEIKVSPLGANAIPSLWPFLIGGLVVMKLALAMDAWSEAKSVNKPA